MTKTDIFEKVQDSTGLTRKESGEMVEAVFFYYEKHPRSRRDAENIWFRKLCWQTKG